VLAIVHYCSIGQTCIFTGNETAKPAYSSAELSFLSSSICQKYSKSSRKQYTLTLHSASPKTELIIL
jgi:hypothetical protein